MSDELKPCKRCGGKAMLVINDSEHEYDWDWFVQCKACYERTDTYSSIDKAITAWNTRANDNMTAENVVSNKRVDANDGSMAQADSREELEADINYYLTRKIPKWATNIPMLNSTVLQWLDRQAAITSKEWCYSHDALEEELERVRAERDELQEQREKQAATIKDLTSECNILRWELGELENNMGREIAELLDENGAIEVFNELGKRRLVTGTQRKLEKHVEELTAERDELRDIIAHMPKTEQECEACQEAHDRLMFNSGVDIGKLRDELKHKQLVIDRQRDSFLKLETENAKLRKELDGCSR